MSQTRDLWVSPEILDTAQPESHNSENYANQPSLIEFLCGSLSILWKEWPKQMECTVLDDANKKFSMTGKCPHNIHDSVFTLVTSVHHFERHNYAAVLECQGCRGLILGIAYRSGTNNWLYGTHYPLGKPDDSVASEVMVANPTIASDFSEALRCLWVDSYKAAVAMCRRSVEATCKHFGAAGRTLEKKIDNLEAQGKITKSLKEMAHAVRLSGNKSLHGKNELVKNGNTATETAEDCVLSMDDLDLFGRDEAEAMIAFTKELFHHVFVMPALLEKYRPKPKGEASEAS
jgi:hypothetical protein